MSIELFEATKEERLYASQQSSQIAAQTGCMAKYQAAFSDKGDELLESMKVIGSNGDKEAYTAELNKLLEQLKTDKACGAPLSGRTALSRFCFHHTTAKMTDMDGWQAFRADSGDFAFIIRVNPRPGEANIHIFIYISKWLDSHIEAARRGIRFIDPSYNELFRIPDGGKVKITYPDGKAVTRAVRYIDEYHAEIGNGLYHICEFAESMESKGCKVEPVTPAMPSQLRTREVNEKEGGFER